MKIYIQHKKALAVVFGIGLLLGITGCEKKLDYVSFGDLNTVIKTPEGAAATVNAAYTGLAGGSDWQGGAMAGTYSWKTQAMMTTDEGVCAWGGDWSRMFNLNFTPDFDWVTHNYTRYLPYISRITIALDGLNDITLDENLKKRYAGELKALRAYYAQQLYFSYGPLTIITDPKIAADPDAAPVARPGADDMVKQIEQDWLAAIDALPAKFTGGDYGRFSKTAALTGLMKLYMYEKQWPKAVTTGQQIKTMGYSLETNYQDLFNINNKGGSSREVILSVVCTNSADVTNYTNMWLAHSLPSDYKDSAGISLTAWGGYKMPWKSYDKFSSQDKRLSVLLQRYPIGKNADGSVKYKDARAAGDIGAVPMKYAPDPAKANAQNSAIDMPIYRYADVLLMLAESINEASGSPNSEAYGALNDVRTRAGLTPVADGLNHDQFLAKIQDERLFELWGEGWRRDDLIRWNKYTQRAANDGSGTAEAFKVLFPLPRTAITQSNGIIKQNTGYN